MRPSPSGHSAEGLVDAVRAAFTKRWPYEVTPYLWDTIRASVLAGVRGESLPSAGHPMQPLETDAKGVLRFKKNAIVRFMLDTGRNLGAFDLNKLGVMEFSDADRQQFAQLIGYSLSGYSELSYVS